MGLRHGPDSYGRQQWGIFRNGRKPDGATPRGREVVRDVKPCWRGRGRGAGNGPAWTVPAEEAAANYVPAAAVTRRRRALSGIIGRKGSAGGGGSADSNRGAQPRQGPRTPPLEGRRGRRNSRCSGEMRRYREEHRWRRRPPGLHLTLRLESQGSERD